MEWIIYGFFGVMGVIVATIIGIAIYQTSKGKGANDPNQGPSMSHKAGDAAEIRNHVDHSAGGPSGGGMT